MIPSFVAGVRGDQNSNVRRAREPFNKSDKNDPTRFVHYLFPPTSTMLPTWDRYEGGVL